MLMSLNRYFLFHCSFPFSSVLIKNIELLATLESGFNVAPISAYPLSFVFTASDANEYPSPA